MERFVLLTVRLPEGRCLFKMGFTLYERNFLLMCDYFNGSMPFPFYPVLEKP